MKKKILIVVGTRPNFIKVTLFKKLVKAYSNLSVEIVHTGQHYDKQMSHIFFEQFDLLPDYFLNVEGSSNQTMEQIRSALEQLFLQSKPHFVLVVGDVNSTLVAAEAANKCNIPIGHIESGLRSFDSNMPEEYNRIQTDAMASLYFVTEQAGIDNLRAEGRDENKIFFVGNTMIDTMIAFRDKIDECTVLSELSLQAHNYIVSTIHRPSNVDTKEGLIKMIDLFVQLSAQYKIVFPMHPRTLMRLKEHDLYEVLLANKNVVQTQALDYFSFQKLVQCAKLVITDSGGIQEETTYLKVPCLTLRENTERPVTISEGTNELVPFSNAIINAKVQEIENGTFKKGTRPLLWDGNATARILEVLNERLA